MEVLVAVIAIVGTLLILAASGYAIAWAAQNAKRWLMSGKGK